MKNRTREWDEMDEAPRPANPLLPLAWVFVAAAVAAVAIIAVTGYYYATTGIYLPTFFTSVREYNEAQATAEVTGTARPVAPPVAAPAAPRAAQPGGVVSQPAEVATAAPIERVPVEGKVDAAPAVLAAPEPPKATPAGKAEPTPEPKVRGGKGTP